MERVITEQQANEVIQVLQEFPAKLVFNAIVLLRSLPAKSEVEVVVHDCLHKS